MQPRRKCSGLFVCMCVCAGSACESDLSKLHRLLRKHTNTNARTKRSLQGISHSATCAYRLVIVVVIIAVMRRQYVQVASQSQKVYTVPQPAQPTCNAFIVHHVSDIGFDYEVVVVVVAAVLTFAIALTLLSLPAIIIIAAFLLMFLLKKSK